MLAIFCEGRRYSKDGGVNPPLHVDEEHRLKPVPRGAGGVSPRPYKGKRPTGCWR
jgi:hypothetical protein